MSAVTAVAPGSAVYRDRLHRQMVHAAQTGTYNDGEFQALLDSAMAARKAEWQAEALVDAAATMRFAPVDLPMVLTLPPVGMWNRGRTVQRHRDRTWLREQAAARLDVAARSL